jgi:esterase/lipase
MYRDEKGVYRFESEEKKTTKNSFRTIKNFANAGMELIDQIKIKNGLEKIYYINDTPSLFSFVIKNVFYLPSIIWKLRKLKEMKSERFWYLNRRNEAIQGIIYGPNYDRPLPLIAFDSGYKRDLFNFSIVGKVIACLGYRAFSIRSRNELKVIEAEDYIDAAEFLRTKYEKRNKIGDKSGVIGISGGNIVVYKMCSNKEFIEKNNLKCGVSISPFADLAEQFVYTKETLKKENIDKHTREVLEDYNRYVEALGIKNTSDKSIFVKGSPIVYVNELKVPLLIEHGIKDDIVPVTGSLKIYSMAKKAKKDVELVLVPGKGIHGDIKEWRRDIIGTISLISSIIYTYSFIKKHLDC